MALFAFQIYRAKRIESSILVLNLGKQQWNRMTATLWPLLVIFSLALTQSLAVWKIPWMLWASIRTYNTWDTEAKIFVMEAYERVFCADKKQFIIIHHMRTRSLFFLNLTHRSFTPHLLSCGLSRFFLFASADRNENDAKKKSTKWAAMNACSATNNLCHLALSKCSKSPFIKLITNLTMLSQCSC